MAFAQLFDNRLARRMTLQYNDGTAQRTLLKIDCTSSEEMSLEAQATLHDIEDGARISDHVIKKGRTLNIEGIISDSPINLTGALIGNVTGFASSQMSATARATAAAAAVVMANLALSDSAKPSKAALDIFEEIYANNTLLTIVAGLATYENMILERFSAPRKAGTAGALVFSAGFRQVSIIAGQSVAVPKEAKSDNVKDLSSSEKQKGTQQGQVIDDAKLRTAESWALKLGRLVVGDE
jgi:hypothetical protein